MINLHREREVVVRNAITLKTTPVLPENRIRM
jgi:hypothetical protein